MHLFPTHQKVQRYHPMHAIPLLKLIRNELFPDDVFYPDTPMLTDKRKPTSFLTNNSLEKRKAKVTR
jgi:hypothetical protein